MEHMFNDIIGGGSNGSFRGSPGPDCDIYGNFVSHCWDDGLEVEGGSRNVRLWDNYISQCLMMIGNAADSIGPLYIWRNVCARSQWKPGTSGGNFLKMGFAGGEHWMTGHMYIFHNTVFRSDEWLPTGALGGNRIVKHTVSRNNILQVRFPVTHHQRATTEHRQNYDYDLFNGRFLRRRAARVRGERSMPRARPRPAARTGDSSSHPIVWAPPGRQSQLQPGYAGKRPHGRPRGAPHPLRCHAGQP